jgi:signal transduction histidine kinase/ActR/RegA family two-component response regulator
MPGAIVKRLIEESENPLAAIMMGRRRQVVFRLAMMALMVTFFWPYLSLTAMCVWAALYVALQAWDYIALSKTPVGEAQIQARRVASIVTLALNSVVFGLPGVLWAHFGGLLGLVCGAYLLSGSILNTVLTTRSCRPAFLALLLPFIVYVMMTAFIAAGENLKLGAFVTVGIAGSMMSLSAIRLWIDASKTERSEMAALISLNERETQLKVALRQAEEASQAKSAFLANMSHELRTPLNGVLGMVSVMAKTDLTASQSEMLDVISMSAKNLQALISDVLDLAKIEAAQIDLQSDVLAPAIVARSVSALFAAACAEKGLSLDLDVDAESENGILADSVRLTQILTNLCSNAIKFTERGGVKLFVRTVTKGASRTVVFAVADTGIGMSEEGQGRLFERFAQADGSITRRFGGTGLGLSISKSLADLMGGEIEVTSAEGVGSTFTVTIDFPAAELPNATPAKASSELAPLDGGEPAALRVLLVEDHPVNRQVVQLILAGVADVDIAVNGEEGVEAAKINRYDVILMDMQMPVMDGVTATRAIRNREAEQGLARIPVIMLTANAMSDHAVQSVEAGADMHLAKPITADALLAALDEVLDKAEADTFDGLGLRAAS